MYEYDRCKFYHTFSVFTCATQYKLWINKSKYVCSAVPVEADGEGGQYFRKNEVLWTLFVYNITSTYVLLAKEFPFEINWPLGMHKDKWV